MEPNEHMSHDTYVETVVTDQLADLQLQMNEIRETLKFIEEHIVRADKTIGTVAEQVMPTLNQLMESPMLKMLGVRKTK